MKPSLLPLSFLLLLGVVPAAAAAADREVPYWASLRVDEVNMRVGPGEDYRILWVYKRKELPVKVLRLKEGWRLVQDPDGVQGWMLARFLNPKRGALVVGDDLAEMRGKGDPAAKLLWRLEPGVTGMLGDCSGGWCGLTVGEHKGYVRQDRLWGAGTP